jgi:hypothetical protein
MRLIEPNHGEEMSDFIQVNIRDDPNFFPDPAERRFIVGVSRELIHSDLSRGDSSLVRKFFHSTVDLEKFIDEHLREVQESVAGDLALHHAGILRPALRTLPVHFDFRHDPPIPSRSADAAVGGFPIWVV